MGIFDLQRFATAGPSTGSGRVRRKRSGARSKEPAAAVYPLRRVTRTHRLPRSRPARPAAVPPPPAFPPQDFPALTTKYVVQAGDTLHRIARRFGTTARLLAALNHLHKPALLVPGEVVLVPDTAGSEDGL